MGLTRRRLHSALAAALTLGFSRTASAASLATPVEVWHDPACGCCEAWVRHMHSAEFAVTAYPTTDMVPVKVANGIPLPLQSCHTSRIGGYVIEGHVPATDVRRLLAERPQARGLAAPGMPASAPGMDLPGEAYDVVLFGTPTGERVWARH